MTRIFRVALRVFGTVLVSFPAAVVPVLTDLSTDIGLLNFTVVNADKIKTILPNKQVVSLLLFWISVFYFVANELILVDRIF